MDDIDYKLDQLIRMLRDERERLHSICHCIETYSTTKDSMTLDLAQGKPSGEQGLKSPSGRKIGICLTEPGQSPQAPNQKSPVASPQTQARSSQGHSSAGENGGKPTLKSILVNSSLYSSTTNANNKSMTASEISFASTLETSAECKTSEEAAPSVGKLEEQPAQAGVFVAPKDPSIITVSDFSNVQTGEEIECVPRKLSNQTKESSEVEESGVSNRDSPLLTAPNDPNQKRSIGRNFSDHGPRNPRKKVTIGRSSVIGTTGHSSSIEKSQSENEGLQNRKPSKDSQN